MASFHEVLRTARVNRSLRNFPDCEDPRTRDGLLFPGFRPKFPINFSNTTVFTIGSCFARNVEQALRPFGVNLPTADFDAPKSEYPYRGNGLLNEYNPGTMNQRILFALGGKEYPPETIVQSGDLYIDLLLPPGGAVMFERAVERRREIASIYRQLASSDLVIITLGLVETWFDHETKLYLNQLPPPALAAKSPKRFEFKRLGVTACMRLLEEAFSALTGAGPKILLTVSPVPLRVTFSDQDSVVANEFSKSVLRVVAERLAALPTVDYFPSYEIVRSGGLSAYVADQVHVRPEVVEQVIDFMLAAYAKAGMNAATETAAE